MLWPLGPSAANHGAFSVYTNFILIRKVNRICWIFMTGSHMTVQDDQQFTHNQKCQFPSFVQKAALCNAILTFFKAVRFKVISALLFR